MKTKNSYYFVVVLSVLALYPVKNAAQEDIWQLKVSSNAIFKPVTFSKIVGDSISFTIGKENICVDINSIEEIRNVKSNSGMILNGAKYGFLTLGSFSILYYLIRTETSHQKNGNLTTLNYYLIPRIGVAGGFIGAVIGAALGTIAWLASCDDTVYRMDDLTINQKRALIDNQVMNSKTNTN